MCSKCGSTTIIGDNNGESCMNCGQPLAGYGYGGQQNTCIHSWYGEPHMKYKSCTFCEVTMLNELYNPKADNIRHCPECKEETRQEVVLYNPDHPEDGEAWQCKDCKEISDLFTH